MVKIFRKQWSVVSNALFSDTVLTLRSMLTYSVAFDAIQAIYCIAITFITYHFL